jgi:hypothetical protein
MVRTNIPITGLNEPGENEGHRHLQPAGLIPVFAELSRIKSAIGIKYPKMKFFWWPAPGVATGRQDNRAVKGRQERIEVFEILGLEEENH